MKRYLISLLMLLPSLLLAAVRLPVVHHELSVVATPANGHLQVEDRLTLPQPKRELHFLLHEGLIPELHSPGGKLVPGERVAAAVPARRWTVRLSTPTRRLRLSWSGTIRHPPQRERLHATPGTISPEGIQLSGSTLWFPWIDGHLLTFRMNLSLPEGWHGISQGRPGKEEESWEENHPQDDLYLVAAPFTRYRKPLGEVTAMAWLRQPDADLADRYLEATARYLRLYSRLIGPYPYAKFALVENFWSSGYGMPSFTLLGSRIIRLPFILRSSFPHEILHNWWGNSVYVDWAGGNWSEGLTAYLADHLLQEQQGKGAQYRRDTLLKYANWVKQDNDIPLVRFRARHGEASQAAGYGRMLMLTHMLRRLLGDTTFIEGLRRFYRDNRFAIAGFDDLRAAFEAVSGRDLGTFFRQWTRRTGAPALRLSSVRVERQEKSYRVSGLLEQVQPEAPFALEVPLYLQLEGTEFPRVFQVKLTGREAPFQLVTERRPLRLRADARFDLFRRLDPGEIPPSLGGLFSARPLLVVLPSRAPQERRGAYRKLAEVWRSRYPGLEIVEDSALQGLPDKGAVWILGKENRFTDKVLRQLPRLEARLEGDHLLIGDRPHPLAGGSLVLAAGRSPALGLLLLANPTQAPSLARRLPHYGKYGYLLFDAQGRNRLKGQWTVGGGALEVALAKGPLPPLHLPPRPPLVDADTAEKPGG